MDDDAYLVRRFGGLATALAVAMLLATSLPERAEAESNVMLVPASGASGTRTSVL